VESTLAAKLIAAAEAAGEKDRKASATAKIDPPVIHWRFLARGLDILSFMLFPFRMW
jgi:hypothetical protein